MCRGKSERPDRCPCDTSEARRLRRHNSSTREKYSNLAIAPPKPIYYPVVENDESCTIEVVKEEIKSVHTLRAKLNPFLRHRKESSYGFFPEHDRQLNNLGAGVEYLAETKYGAPTDLDLKLAVISYETTFIRYKTAALREGKSLNDAHDEAANKVESEFGDSVEESLRPLIEKRSEAYRDTLSELGVIFANPDSLEFAVRSHKAAITSLKKALAFYPQSWLDASNQQHKTRPFLVSDSSIRAEYRNITKGLDKDWNVIDVAELTVTKRRNLLIGEDRGMPVALHEFAHRSEDVVKGIVRYEEFFLRRRAGYYHPDGSTPKPEKQTEIYKGSGEEGFKDNFPLHYMGKTYKGKAFEILSMGMEAVFAGEHGAFAGVMQHKADSDYKRFILGLLASFAVT